MVPLGDLPGGLYSSEARGMNGDGSIIVGNSSSSDNSSGEATRWTAANGFKALGAFRTFSAYGSDITPDGSVIVGSGYLNSLHQAFVYDDVHGVRTLRDIITAGGVELGNWILDEASGISADGNTIVGYGTDPAGFTEGFVVTLPEPCSLGVISAAAATYAVGVRRQRRQRDR